MVSDKRRSWVEKIFDWPRGTRERGWGILHDRVWFPLGDGSYMSDHPEETQIRKFDGRWYRMYLDRRMLWLGPIKIRIHTFYSGDDDSAPHDHPW